MTERQSQFLYQIIESYNRTAEPVASGLLAEHADVSSATVRNDMAMLEEHGYIVQPHTSAGRIPTIKGYEFYLEHFLQPKKPTSAQMKKLEDAKKREPLTKALAKELAELSGQTVFIAFAENDFYYTGISYLFSQPEFHQPEAVINISSVLDALDQTLVELYETATDEIQILLGKQNPFSVQCGLLLSKTKVNKKEEGVIGILGPTRMNYNQTIGLLNYSKELLNS
jgi:heat-inducible transcriptional repressor